MIKSKLSKPHFKVNMSIDNVTISMERRINLLIQITILFQNLIDIGFFYSLV